MGKVILFLAGVFIGFIAGAMAANEREISQVLSSPVATNIRAAMTATPLPQTRTPTSGTIPGDGMYLIGKDIEPGIYHSTGAFDEASGKWRGTKTCYWMRLSGLGGSLDEIIASDRIAGPRYIEIKATDMAFESQGCGEWVKQ